MKSTTNKKKTDHSGLTAEHAQRIHCFIESDALNEKRRSELNDLLDGNQFGAKVVFEGQVRKNNHGKEVVSVAYDTFEPLALKTLRAIAEETLELASDMRVVMWHRQGNLKVGETSVWIGVSTVHRAECYEASRKLIEELKARAPIWKKEVYVDGETEWLKGHALCAHT